MTKRKWEKQFIYEPLFTAIHPREKLNEIQNLVGVEDPAKCPAKAAFILSGGWIKPGMVKPDSEALKPHYHDYDELLLNMGTDPVNWSELGGEIEIWIEDEKYIVNRTCLIFMPAGVQHGPYFVKRVDKPFLAYAISAGAHGFIVVSDDPKWSHLKDYPK